MKKLIRGSESANIQPASDWLEDGIFRNYTPEQVAERIKSNVGADTIKSNLTEWVKQQEEYNNIDDAKFGQAVIDILIEEGSI